jgi:tetratricopeptide (TPR) repeat protein
MRTVKLKLLFCILPILGLGCALAAPAKSQMVTFFNQGDSEYGKGNYKSAEQYYRQILDSGLENGSVYYNLGNACFKQKRLGEAIYYWEKARQNLPGDRDIRENLQFANLLLVDRIETPADPLPLQILARVHGFFTITQESWLVLIFAFGANLLFSLYLKAKNARNAFRALLGSLIVGILFVVFACSLSWKIYGKEHRKEGVVIEQKVDVRSGPGPENITVFAVHEGIKVRVHESSHGWYQISLPNGWSGWLPQDFLRIL